MKIPKDMTPGTIFPTKKWGNAKILSYTDHRNILVEFIETGYRNTVRSEFIRTGRVKDPFVATNNSVGFIGVGPYSSGKDIKEYMFWSNLLERSYCPKLKKRAPTYANVSCSPEWHNFQEFAEWCQWQVGFKEDGWHLDKDLLCSKEKIYSPETCVFLPIEINSFLSTTNSNGLAQGVYKSENSFRVTVKDCFGNKISRRFRTERLASDFYQENKKQILLKLLEKFGEKLDPRAVFALEEKYIRKSETFNGNTIQLLSR